MPTNHPFQTTEVFYMSPYGEEALEIDCAARMQAGETLAVVATRFVVKSTGEDEAETYLAGDASVEGSSIISPVISGLVRGESYELQHDFTAGGRTDSVVQVIKCTL